MTQLRWPAKAVAQAEGNEIKMRAGRLITAPDERKADQRHRELPPSLIGELLGAVGQNNKK